VRNASSSLKTIASAQADIRANDRDWNHVNDYWRSDIAGLYTVGSEGHEIKLIELSVAAADDRPTTNIEKYSVKSPKAGFWYRALPHADEKTARGPDRFAACSFPVNLSAGRYGTYIVGEDNTILRRLLGHAKGIEAYPTPAELKAKEWEKID
jgi:hypothetical protein